ncbi:hypothetical protein QTP86_004704 [Hemibagrus guttatus]|nr:hypothetical protein QTP86_004704 [Hemibagrus guttatus]
MYSFLILSNLVTPKENLNIFSSATSSSDSCLFLSDTVSKPYSMAGLTTVLYDDVKSPRAVVNPDISKIRNIGIMAHIDAGKTTTTERMLYYSGYTRALGDVDDGDTVTDYMAQERERGITIQSAAVTFDWKEHRINLIDTPGHVDFTLEVERALRVLDGAVAVFDASAGVEAQTMTVWRQAEKHNIPCVCFLNKMDKPGASMTYSVESIKTKLKANPILLQLPVGSGKGFMGLVDLITKQQMTWRGTSWADDGRAFETKALQPPDDPEFLEEVNQARATLLEQVADLDDEFAELLLGEYGLTGNLLSEDIVTLPLVSITRRWYKDDLCALAFKVVHDKQRGPLVFLRIYSGSMKPQSAVYNINRNGTERMSRLLLPFADQQVEIPSVSAGNIALTVGLKQTVTGDTIVSSKASAAAAVRRAHNKVDEKRTSSRQPQSSLLLAGVEVPEPVFFCSIEPPSMAKQADLEHALNCLQREDPSLKVRTDPDSGQTVLCGMGELHIEILHDRIRREYKLETHLGPLQVAYRETINQSITTAGKGRELADMMERRKVDILCVQETRWKGSKARSIGAGFKLFYYGVDSKRNGVGVVLKEEFVRNVLEVGCELEEKERFWSELDEVMESIPTGERVVIGADFNGHVGEGNTGDEEVMGKFGVKERNLEGQMVVDFAKRMDMGVVNTYFQKREEHRVTYKSGGRRTQIEKKTKWWKLKKEECSEVIRETGRKVLGVSSGRRKEDKETWWWNEEVQDSIQRKRLAKKKWDMDRTEENRQEYKELQRRVKREVSKAKQKAYDELYTRLDTREGEKDLYRLARQRDRDGKDVQQVRVIKDRDGRVLTSEESVQRRWKEYFEELMNEENEREKRVEGVNSVEQKVDKIRKDEVRKALKRMKSGKAVGPDDIPVEVWKCLGEAAVEFLANLFNRVLENLEKAYDRVPREELWYCMRKSGVAEKYVRVVQDMYERSRTVVRCAVVMDQLSEEVRQESPWTMMFADDIVICSESREQVEENLERWRFALERRGMKVSRSKTEYMCVNEREGSGTVRLQGEEVKKVQEFKYLGSTVQSNGECGKEVKKRVQAGWNGWRKVSGVLCDQKISARIKGKVYRTVVRPAMLYGLETVSLRKRQESELEVAELKMLRFSLGVTRLDRIRNEYIRGTAHVGRLGDKVREARLRWFGHVQRRENTLDRTLGEKRHVVTVELTVSPWEAPAPGTSSCHMTYDEEAEAHISADIKAAVDSGVQSAYLQGPVLGYPVQGVLTVIHSVCLEPGTSLAMVSACVSRCMLKGLKQAEGQVLEPVMSLEVTVDEEYLSSVLGDLAQRRGMVRDIQSRQDSRVLLAIVPLAEMMGYSTALRTLTSGSATFSLELASYEPMNPQDQKALLNKMAGLA